MKQLWKRITGDWWIAKNGGFPYPAGYVTYNRRRNMILDNGLTKDHAEALCKELNTTNQ